MTKLRSPTIAWLLEGDPAIRWQALRDLCGTSDRVVERERRKIEKEGWGARLLAEQDAAGRWGVRGKKTGDIGLYTPKWTSTTYTMLLLRDFGLRENHPAARKAAKLLLDRGLRGDDGISYGTWADWSNRGETCITGMVLSLLAYFGIGDRRVDRVVAHLLREQMPDGGWNCRRAAGATHSSVNTTISALEGLHRYQLTRGRPLPTIKKAMAAGQEFLLAHRLFRSHRTGQVIKPEFLRFVFPPRWHYDVLRALDHFQAVAAPRDPRLEDGIDLVRSRQTDDGRWTLEYAYSGQTYFPLERLGAPSRWNTLRALRVLTWWDGG